MPQITAPAGTDGADDAAQDDTQNTDPTQGAASAKTTGTDPQTAAPTLESRLAGLEARLAERGRSQAQIEKERDELRQRLADYEAGKLTENEAFQAELKRERDRADLAERTARLARIEAKFPETFGVFGEKAADLDEEQLAAAEARFAGRAPEEGDQEPPTPRTPTTPRPSATSAANQQRREDGETLAQMRARFRATTPPWLNEG